MTAHTYGYTLDEDGQLVTGSCTTGAGHASCFQETSHQCHGDFYCVQCLAVHVREVGGTFAGQLNREVTS